MPPPPPPPRKPHVGAPPVPAKPAAAEELELAEPLDFSEPASESTRRDAPLEPANKVVRDPNGPAGWQPWTSPKGMRDFCGNPVRSDAVFFMAPPADIGVVLRAESTWLTREKQEGWGKRIAIILAFQIMAVPFWAYGLYAGSGLWLAGGLFFAAILMLFPWRFMKFTKVACAYVGRDGAIRYVFKGKGARPKEYMILYSQAAELRTGRTQHYYNGQYSGTSYRFEWTDTNGHSVLVYKGGYRAESGDPEEFDPYHFGAATEIAWSEYLLKYADRELQRNGALYFNIANGKAIRVGPGFIEFLWGSETVRLEQIDIGRFDLRDGAFRIHHKDAKWYSFTGKFSFEYRKMGNAKLFLLALRQFIKVPIN